MSQRKPHKFDTENWPNPKIVPLADLYKSQVPTAPTAPTAPPTTLPTDADAYLIAYASLFETVRMFLDGTVNRKYLTKRHYDIEEDLKRARRLPNL